MTTLRNLPLPFGEPIAKPPRAEYKGGQDPQAGFMTLAWINALTALMNQINSIPVTEASESLTDQSASIPATDITGGKLNAGEYRLGWWYGVTTVNGVSSSLQVDFEYTFRGVAKTIKGVSLTANDNTEAATDVVFFPADGNTPVRYTVTYATGVGAPMLYDFRMWLESVPA